MKTDTFIKRFKNKAITDDITVTSKDFKSFATCFKNYLKRTFPDAKVENFSAGHYDVSSFIVFPSGTIVYVHYDVPRGERPIDVNRRDASGGVLYRTAKSTKDYSGGSNNFTSLLDMKEIRRLDR